MRGGKSGFEFVQTGKVTENRGLPPPGMNRTDYGNGLFGAYKSRFSLGILSSPFNRVRIRHGGEAGCRVRKKLSEVCERKLGLRQPDDFGFLEGTEMEWEMSLTPLAGFSKATGWAGGVVSAAEQAAGRYRYQGWSDKLGILERFNGQNFLAIPIGKSRRRRDDVPLARNDAHWRQTA